ncbi:Endo-1,4-beta-xylanase 5, partial [Ceratobasidium sp. 428]
MTSLYCYAGRDWAVTLTWRIITGYPGHENDMRKAVKKVLGEEKYNFFFDKFLEYFFTEKDAEFFASLGLNCIR